ncbi:conserved hypothetical protein [Theileria orientalis strain Shintoku]|uniref:Uncharacterized protein n=1 Tax=Theileria orientalis strain Shintoku TaxID=869250 RepID=J4CDV2_THEOR|nr:conserved hypothetical protein [Theileria orientalis strain Shintoku]BAM41787.1 conserved hypothetical protein [Theileria orientalis strain Shintoku]|eukprot:XP_009692088.1 conserved hypothetical protein [Theileria orientalis strain Shintoku]
MSYISAETQSYFGGVKTDLSTDIKISDVDLNVYISYKNGVIESYNSTSFKVLRSIDVNSFNNLLPWENPQKKYSQKMKIELICQDSFVLFNNSDSVGMVSLKDGSLNRYIRMRNDERDGVFAHLSDGNAPECCDPSCSTSRATQPRDVMLLKGVSDIATIPSIREIYIINESGQLFVLHPGSELANNLFSEYKKLFKQA